MHNKIIGFVISALWTYLLLMLSERYSVLALPIYLILPCALAVYTAVQGSKAGILAALLVCALTALLPYSGYSILLAFWAGGAGVSLGGMFRSKTRTKKLVVFTSFAYLVLFGGGVALYNWSYQTDLIGNLLSMLERLTEYMIVMLADSAALSDIPGIEQEIEAAASVLRSYPGLLNDNFPAYFVIAVALFGYIFFALTKRLMRNAGVDTGFIRPFSEYRLPKSMLVFVGLLVVIGVITSDYLPMMFHYNVMNILLFVFGLAGLSYLDWWLKARAVPFAVRIILFLGLLLVRMMLPIIDIFQVLMILGILDTVLDFRNKRGVRL